MTDEHKIRGFTEEELFQARSKFIADLVIKQCRDLIYRREHAAEITESEKEFADARSRFIADWAIERMDNKDKLQQT